jgi:hypothetical protein
MKLIQKIYVALFGRPADLAGLHFWQAALDEGTPLSTVVELMSRSKEFQSLFSSLTWSETATVVYSNMFGSQPTPQSLSALEEKKSIGELFLALEHAETVSSGAETLLSRLDAAEQFTAELEGLNFPKAFCGEVAAELARAFLGTITGETPSTLDSIQKAIAAQIALGGGAQNPGDHPEIPLGVEYTLNGTITPHRVDGNEKLLLIGEGSAEGFAIGYSATSGVELGIGVRSADAAVVESTGYAADKVALFEANSDGTLLLSIASLQQIEIIDLDIRLSLDIDPTEGVDWRHYQLEGDAENGYVWALDFDGDGVPNSPCDAIQDWKPVSLDQGSFMIVNFMELGDQQGTFDVKLEAFLDDVISVDAAARINVIGQNDNIVDW